MPCVPYRRRVDCYPDFERESHDVFMDFYFKIFFFKKLMAKDIFF